MANGYIPNEESARLGTPIDLYTFTSDNETLRFADSDSSYTLNGDLYTALTVQPDVVEQSGQLDIQPFRLILDPAAPIVQRFTGYIPSSAYWLEIERLHRDDPDQEVNTLWHGQVRGVKIARGQAEMSLDPAIAVFKRIALRRTYQQLCNNVLYDRKCKVNRADFLTTSFVSSAVALTIHSADVAAKPDGWFSGGYVETFGGSRRSIVKHIGNAITLLAPFNRNEVEAGDLVDAFAGCAHDFSTCIAKYDNEDNYGGWPFGPKDNIFVTGLH